MKLTTINTVFAADQYEIRDLRLYSARDLRTLLEEEATLWRSQLRWDYAHSIELLLGYLDSRILPGFVALHGATRRIAGYTFAVYETQKAVIGDLFSSVAPSIETEEKQSLQRMLLYHLLPMLQHTPGVDRIESQLLLADETLQNVFEEHGFRGFRRLFMEASLPDPRELMPPGSLVCNDGEPAAQLLPENLKLRRWTGPMYQPAADLIHRAYQNHGDSTINDQYRTVQGCLRFLHNIIRFPGCGIFSSEHSWVLLDERSGDLEGLVLVSLVEPKTAHIPQLCLSARRRGRGLGRLLLRHAATGLARAGLEHVTLTVTETNEPALRLYKQLGFRTRHPFHANVWNH